MWEWHEGDAWLGDCRPGQVRQMNDVLLGYMWSLEKSHQSHKRKIKVEAGGVEVGGSCNQAFPFNIHEWGPEVGDGEVIAWLLGPG